MISLCRIEYYNLKRPSDNVSLRCISCKISCIAVASQKFRTFRWQDRAEKKQTHVSSGCSSAKISSISRSHPRLVSESCHSLHPSRRNLQEDSTRKYGPHNNTLPVISWFRNRKSLKVTSQCFETGEVWKGILRGWQGIFWGWRYFSSTAQHEKEDYYLFITSILVTTYIADRLACNRFG